MSVAAVVRRLPVITLGVCLGLCVSFMNWAHGMPWARLRPPSVQASEQGAGDRAGRAGEEARSATLEELYAAPSAWLGRWVEVTFQKRSLPPTWNPGPTRFGSGDYVAVDAWSDAQLPWRQDDFDGPLGLLFARRGGAAASVLEAAPAHARFRSRARVRQVFLGQPWIEIDSLERCPEEIGEGAVLHASRALQSMSSAAWQRALEDLARASASNLPLGARQEIGRLRERCEAELAHPARG